MFNLGFFELIVVIVVGLLVLGPERFPKVARQIAKLINELKRVFFDIKSGFDDIQLETEKILEEVKKETDLDIKSQFGSIQTKARDILEEIRKEGKTLSSEKSKKESVKSGKEPLSTESPSSETMPASEKQKLQNISKKES